jgi:uncharacterized protein YndB with AHSA1/START domain
MSGRSVEHASFVVERKYEASPERAFAAWADPEAKARWYSDSEAHLELDFRVGGREHSRGTAPDGSAYSYEALFQDIVPAERIVYTYDMHLEETRISVSLATVSSDPWTTRAPAWSSPSRVRSSTATSPRPGAPRVWAASWTPWKRSSRAIPRVPERQPSFDWHIALVCPEGSCARKVFGWGIGCLSSDGPWSESLPAGIQFVGTYPDQVYLLDGWMNWGSCTKGET